MNKLFMLSVLLFYACLTTEHSTGQVLKARERFAGRDYLMSLENKSVERRKEHEIVAGVRAEMKQFITDSLVNFNPVKGCSLGESREYSTIESELTLTESGTGQIVLTSLVDSSINPIYSRKDSCKSITSLPKHAYLRGGRLEMNVEHDASLTVTERRRFQAAPSVTLHRFEQYFSNPVRQPPELLWIIEKSLDHRFSIIWIKEAEIVTDSVATVSNVDQRTVIISSRGMADNHFTENQYEILIHIEFLNQRIQRVKYDIISKIIPSTSFDADLGPLFSGEGRFSLEIDRQQ